MNRRVCKPLLSDVVHIRIIATMYMQTNSHNTQTYRASYQNVIVVIIWPQKVNFLFLVSVGSGLLIM